MDLGIIVTILVIIIILFIITHIRPLNEREILKLSQKRRKSKIKEYFSFNNSEYNVDKEFKRKMKADGKFYQISKILFEFPSIAAGLLKYKKHEWIIVAFEKNRKVDLLWLNKGIDRNTVSSSLSADKISQIGKDNNYSSILIFHNHPNPNPNRYDGTKPSKEDIASARYYSQTLSGTGLNLIEFVCERGRHHHYFSSTVESFLPIKGFEKLIMQKNGLSRFQNLLLHIERFI